MASDQGLSSGQARFIPLRATWVIDGIC